MTSEKKPNPGEFCWNELVTPDTKKARDFYTALLGWTAKDHHMDDMTYTMFMQGDKNIGGMYQTPKDKMDHVPPHWMSYVCVEDIEKTFEKAKSLGAVVKVPVTKAGNMGQFTIIEDPTGAHIAFWQPCEGSC
jgi:uncharacterized protein